MGPQPNIHKAGRSVNNEEFTRIVKFFLQVQDPGCWYINQVATSVHTEFSAY